MYGYIYMTINSINNKKYIGQKTSKVFLKENYLGSGKLLHYAVKKYGKESFSVELIEKCNSKEELNEREIYWIKYYDAVNSDEFYNLQAGGQTGNIRGSKMSEESRKKMSEFHKNNPNGIKKYASHPGKSNGMYGRGYLISGEKNGMYRKSNRLFGKRNGCYGKISITNGVQNKFINKEELDKFINKGWKKGSTQKFQDLKGNKNPNFGRRSKYMNKDGKNKMVLLNEVEKYLSNGWKFGMIKYNKRKESI